jgi:hypothetical protein
MFGRRKPMCGLSAEKKEQGLHTLLLSQPKQWQPGENCGFGNGELSASHQKGRGE